MTKEQQEAIELTKQFTKMNFNTPNGWTGYYDTELKELSQAMQIVLSMLQEQQEDNKKKDKIIKKIISRLDNDYKRITETLQDGKHCDDYSRNRLKAYRTKTREIKEYIEEQYFENKAKE